MVIQGVGPQGTVTLSLKPNCITVSIEGGGQAQVYSFDLVGRPWTALLEGVSLRRGLDGQIVAKWITPEGRARRYLTDAEGRAFEAQARTAAADLLRSARDGALRFQPELPPAAAAALARAVAFDAARAAADVAEYGCVYKPVGILPPDQYMAVVLQLTEGCAFNTCSFCTFYRDRPFRIKAPDELATHAAAVRDFLGAGLSLRRTIFLGDANALIAPMPRLRPLLETVHAAFDVAALGGMFAFLDGFSGEKKTARDYAELRDLGLERVYVGLESGSAELLRFLRKPGAPQDAVEALRAMKAGGLAVGVIVLLGAGGETYAAGHVRDTITALNALDLDADDLIYFSELVESAGMPYARDAYAAHLQPLTAAARVAQGEAIAAGLRFRGAPPPISRYDIREFVY
jgi:hypothetical protein